jgi:hypothetical protein
MAKFATITLPAADGGLASRAAVTIVVEQHLRILKYATVS